MELLADESFQLPTKLNEICINVAKAVMKDLQAPSSSSEIFCNWIVTKLSEIVNKAITPNCTRINKEALWPKLFQLQCTSSFIEQWQTYLTTLQLPAEPVFYQNYTMIIFDSLVNSSIPKRVEASTSSRVNSLSFEEENAIRYMGGYVLKSLKDKQKSDDELLHGLKHLTNDDPNSTSTSESEVWVKEISRGRLTHITDEAQQLFVAIEFSIRTNLNLENLYTFNDVSRKTIENLVFADSDVQFYWCLTGVAIEVGDEKADILLDMCIKKWVTIREFSFAKNILEMHKQYSKCSLGKAKALRKIL